MAGDRDVRADPHPRSFRRKRTSRVTGRQIEELLTEIETRPLLFTKKYIGYRGRENFDAAWKVVADKLNQLPNGSIKTPEQWIKVWRDFKSKACTKASKLKIDRLQTGNPASATAPLTDVEKRIISLIGVKYSFDTDSSEHNPEEDTLQHENYAETETEEVIHLPQTQFYEFEFVEKEREQTSPAPELATSGSRTTAVSQPTSEHVQEKILRSPAPQARNHSKINIASSSTIEQEWSRRNRNMNLHRCKQHNSARKHFLSIAESNATSLKILAAATQAQAEAGKVQAEAQKVQAEASMLFAQAANKIADAIVLLANKND